MGSFKGQLGNKIEGWVMTEESELKEVGFISKSFPSLSYTMG